jgi:soluble lytic murein transglycosylase-like protein
MAAQVRPRQAFRAALCCALVVGIVGGVAPGIGFASEPAARPVKKSTTKALHLPDGNPAHAALPRILTDHDKALYRKAFAAIESGQEAELKRALGAIQDPVLLGYVERNRLLGPHFHAHYKELKDWLAGNADLPGAERIYKVAMARKAKSAAPPRAPMALSEEIAVPPDPFAPALNRAVRLPAAVRATLQRDLASGAEAWAAFQDGDYATAFALAGSAARRARLAAPELDWTAGLAAWRLARFDDARHHFEALAQSESASPALLSAGAFWASRASIKTHQPHQVSHFLSLAAEQPRTFYGLLANRALGRPSAFDWTLGPLTDADMAAIAESTPLRRAVALAELGYKEDAEGEVRRLVGNPPPAAARALLALTEVLGMPTAEIAISRKVMEIDGRQHDAASYPMPSWQPSNGRPIDRALVYALIKNESSFRVGARNPSGASGLMQLMPATARFVARRAGIKNLSREAMADPKVNIALGQSYIEHLAKQPEISGNLFYLLAAYNAGPGTLARWVSEDEAADDPLLFLESIHSSETRNFVEQVAADYWIYRMRLGEDTPSLDHVAIGRWPDYSAPTSGQRADNDG